MFESDRKSQTHGGFQTICYLCQVTFWILANFPGLVIYFLVAGVWSLSCV